MPHIPSITLCISSEFTFACGYFTIMFAIFIHIQCTFIAAVSTTAAIKTLIITIMILQIVFFECDQIACCCCFCCTSIQNIFDQKWCFNYRCIRIRFILGVVQSHFQWQNKNKFTEKIDFRPPKKK